MNRDLESPTELLKEEHRVIERMLHVLELANEKALKSGEVPLELYEKAVDFIRVFADRCHHGKEEETLFPLVEQRGVPKNGPTHVMRIEHEQGRSIVRALVEAVERYKNGDVGAKEAIVEYARNYGRLLSQHIWKEDNVLYPLADGVLKHSDRAELIQRFEEVERERIGEANHQKYIDLVGYLEKAVVG
nr:hemerythrin domain-containing protein [Candidatus Njordarchaeum guaymaensis]